MTDNKKPKPTLTEAIKLAAEGSLKGSANDIGVFFDTLLDSDIYFSIPKKNESENKSFEIPIIGADKKDTGTMFPIIDYEGNTCIPIFSEEDFVISWENQECEIVKQSFKSFIWAVPNNYWLYINGDQEYGKEISSWEVALLKLGKDSIPELVLGVSEAEQEDFEINEAPASLKKFEQDLLPILSTYKELSEAYLLSFKESHSTYPRALVGIRYQSEIDPDNQRYVREEIDALSKESLPKDFSSVLIIDDLGNEKSFNQTLFLDAAPFYKRASMKKDT